MDEKTLNLPGWRIIRVIGKGSSGTVYEIEKEDEFGGVAHSALKVISIPERDTDVEEYRQEGYDDKSLTALFRSQVEDITSEFCLMSKLKGCSNIVSFEDHSIVQHEDSPGYDIYIRMELLATLMKAYEQELNERGYSDGYVQRVGTDICRALELCGHFNIIHRDIKPQNIFVNELGDFKLGDFGIAKTSDHTARATKTGTYNYMAPEVYWGRPYNALVDIYSLGLVLYWMMNERRGPFMPLPPELPKPAQNAEAMDRRVHGEPLPAPKNGSEELKRIVLKACAYDPKDRYQSPAEMREDLERQSSASAVSAQTKTRGNTMPTETMRDEETCGRFHHERPREMLSDEEATVGVRSLNGMAAGQKETAYPQNDDGKPSDRIDYKPSVPIAEGADPEEKTIGLFSDKVKTRPENDPDATIGLFSENHETVEPARARKEPEKKPETKPGSDVESEKKKSGKKKIAVLIAAAAAVLAAVAAIVLVVMLKGKDNHEQPASNNWSAIGTICGSSWDKDFPLTEVSPGVFRSELMNLKEGDEFKIRRNNSWDVNYGYDGVKDGDNIMITITDYYYIYFEESTGNIWVDAA